MIQDLSSLERDKLALPNGEARQVLHFFWPLNYWRCPNDGYRAGCKNVWTTVLLFRTTFALTIMLNCWISAGLLIKRPRVQLLAKPTTRVLNELKRERYLCNDIRKRSDFVVFGIRTIKRTSPSDLIHRKIRQVVKQPTHCSHTAGDVVTRVVVSLQLTSGGRDIHNSSID